MNKYIEKNKYLVELGNQIRDVRNHKGWTQDMLADAVGIDRAYLSGIERGVRNVTFLSLVKIAEQLECDIASFTINIPINKERITNPKTR
ncbi:MAG: helix-turn-helix domain-containing protein [Tannerellaceae bacterium]|nr:helix-turn-helix domain-containing protein [Tannerellaceae bacterium]